MPVLVFALTKPATSQWDFNDYYDGAPPTGERRDSQQPVGIAYSTTPTTGFSQAHIPYAGSSNYAQQQPHSYTSPTSTHAQSAYPQAAYAQPVGSRIEGRPVQGSYNPQNPATTLHYETLDSSEFFIPFNFEATDKVQLTSFATGVSFKKDGFVCQIISK